MSAFAPAKKDLDGTALLILYLHSISLTCPHPYFSLFLFSIVLLFPQDLTLFYPTYLTPHVGRQSIYLRDSPN